MFLGVVSLILTFIRLKKTHNMQPYADSNSEAENCNLKEQAIKTMKYEKIKF
jgi:hypothetical protein